MNTLSDNNNSGKRLSLIQLYMRLALGIGYLVPALDRLGVWGAPGGHNISWGDWDHFSVYAHQVMGFLPYGLASVLAVAATIAELIFGVLLLIGWQTRLAATGSGFLALGFALSMAVSFGIVSPLSYSVFVVSASSFLLATIPHYRWSLDERRRRARA
ncbi:MAG TPA: DoxX family protein [Chitinophaga sp.]|uniref:DoxX family protein n=1 Tax=Chitinophaga sp. TaxID=1869181 RepID=UPI002C444908|nr:DoxX family protein [Chitinophaga sp.]HVI43724.1 DoxX family protein [Chitinophaga sp.]